MFLAHVLVDLVIEVADLVVGKGGVLDFGDFAGDFFDDLAAPFFAGWDGGYFENVFGAAGRGRVSGRDWERDGGEGRYRVRPASMMPRSAACCSRKRKSMDWAFSLLRAYFC